MQTANLLATELLQEWDINEIVNNGNADKTYTRENSQKMIQRLEEGKLACRAVEQATKYYATDSYVEGKPVSEIPQNDVSKLSNAVGNAAYLRDPEANPRQPGMAYRMHKYDTDEYAGITGEYAEAATEIASGVSAEDSSNPAVQAKTRQMIDEWNSPLKTKDDLRVRTLAQLTDPNRKPPYATRKYTENLVALASATESRLRGLRDLHDGKMNQSEFEASYENPLREATMEYMYDPEVGEGRTAFLTDAETLAAAGVPRDEASKILTRLAFGADPFKPNIEVDTVSDILKRASAEGTPDKPNPYNAIAEYDLARLRAERNAEQLENARNFKAASDEEKNRLLRNQGNAHLGLIRYAEEFDKYTDPATNPVRNASVTELLENIDEMTECKDSELDHSQFLTDNAELAAKAQASAVELERRLKENPDPETIKELFGEDGFSAEKYKEVIEKCTEARHNVAAAREYAIDYVLDTGLVQGKDEQALAKAYTPKNDPIEFGKTGNLAELELRIEKGRPKDDLNRDLEAANIKAKIEKMAAERKKAEQAQAQSEARRETSLDALAQAETGARRGSTLSSSSHAPEAGLSKSIH